MRERLVAALRPGTGPLILDLSGVSFCDAAGLVVLIGIRRRAAARGIVMLLAAPSPRLHAVLSVTGLDRSLSVHQTVADAYVSSLTRDEVTGGPPRPVASVPADVPEPTCTH